jgi:hypothetical protein
MDDIHPNIYHVGFEIVEIMPDDREVILGIIERYGS